MFFNILIKHAFCVIERVIESINIYSAYHTYILVKGGIFKCLVVLMMILQIMEHIMSIHTKEISIAVVLLMLAAQTGQAALVSRQKWKALSF